MRSITVDAIAFADALNKVSKARCKADVLPILSEVRVSVANGRCSFTATDLDTWLTAEIPAEGDDLSFVFFRTKEVMKACGHFRDSLTIEVRETSKENGLRLSMYSGNRFAEFEASTDSDYPVIPVVEKDAPALRTDASLLLDRVERVKYATCKSTSTSNSKPITACVQCVGNRIYSMDGYRIACDTNEHMRFSRPLMARGAALAHLKLFGTREVCIRIGTRYASIASDDMCLLIRQMNAAPYQVDSAVPQSFREEFYISPADFLKELSYLKEFTAQTDKPYVRMTGDELRFQSLTGSYRTRIQLEGRNDISLGFDMEYMMEALKQFRKEKRVKMKLSGVFSPMILEADGRSDFALLLPVRLKEERAA